MKVERGAKKNQ